MFAVLSRPARHFPTIQNKTADTQVSHDGLEWVITIVRNAQSSRDLKAGGLRCTTRRVSGVPKPLLTRTELYDLVWSMPVAKGVLACRTLGSQNYASGIAFLSHRVSLGKADSRIAFCHSLLKSIL